MSSATKSVKVFETDSEVASKLCEFVIELANAAISERGSFSVALSGGSLAKYLCNGLPTRDTDWSKWHVFFCDERHVGFEHPECTFSIYKTGLFSKVPIPEGNLHPDNPNVTVSVAAEEYQKQLADKFGGVLPQFDLLLLGMGPDGHTCSLFPGHTLLDERVKWVSAISDSPKPPPERITLTYPVLNNARCAVFASCGAGKAQTVKDVLEGEMDPPLPASRVQPTNGQLVWFLDTPAASLLKSSL